MAGARRRKKRGGGYYREYEGWYYNRFGRRVFFKGFRTKAETLDVAYNKESQERKAKILGVALETFVDRNIESVIEEYLAWGNTTGGRRQGAWSAVHARQRRSQLEYWRSTLRLSRTVDLSGRLADAESHLRRLRADGRSGRTVNSYAETLKAFSRWCVQRRYLDVDPFEALSAGERHATRKRRAFTPDELQRVLRVAPQHRRVLYQVAVYTGLRANELRALRLRDLNVEEKLLSVSEQFTKNRIRAVQPIPESIVSLLRAQSEVQSADAPLLTVPSHTARELDEDLLRAGVPKTNSQGILDFHSLRVTFVTWLAESGAHPGEVQELARHSSPILTFGTYARSGLERRVGAVKKLECLLEGDS